MLAALLPLWDDYGVLARSLTSCIFSLSAAQALPLVTRRQDPKNFEYLRRFLNRTLTLCAVTLSFQGTLIALGKIDTANAVAIVNAAVFTWISLKIFSCWCVVIAINTYERPIRFGQLAYQDLGVLDMLAMQLVLRKGGPLQPLPDCLHFHALFDRVLLMKDNPSFERKLCKQRGELLGSLTPSEIEELLFADMSEHTQFGEIFSKAYNTSLNNRFFGSLAFLILGVVAVGLHSLGL